MATIQIQVPDNQVDRILSAFEWTAEKGTKAAFMKQEIINMIKSKVVMVETQNYIPPTPPVINPETIGIS
jgi:hypothetical protein